MEKLATELQGLVRVSQVSMVDSHKGDSFISNGRFWAHPDLYWFGKDKTNPVLFDYTKLKTFESIKAFVLECATADSVLK